VPDDPRICQECPTELTGRQTLYCSTRCASAAQNRGRKDYLRDRRQRPDVRARGNQHRMGDVPCCVCRKLTRKRISRLNERDVVCSTDCRRQLFSVGVSTPIPWYHPHLSTAVPLCSDLRRRTCAGPGCPREFRAVYRGTDYCSDSCRERASRLRFIDRRGYAPEDRGRYRQHLPELWERDRGCCGLCGRPVDKARATVDHVIPQSLIVDDSPWNLQVAHRACNTAKGDRWTIHDAIRRVDLAIFYGLAEEERFWIDIVGQLADELGMTERDVPALIAVAVPIPA
jgi:5-methylcytosine-specific restriction endonuclease McrA